MSGGIGRLVQGALHRRRRRAVLVATATALLMLLLPVATATAGRLIETGEDADNSCVNNPALGGCSFIRVALDYVRSGAPNPSLPVLLFDEPPNHMLSAIRAAYGGSPPFSIDEHKPSAVDFGAMRITTAEFSAIVVASDWTAFNSSGEGDLNSPAFWPPENGSFQFEHPWYVNDPVAPGFGGDAGEVPGSLRGDTPDSDALIAPLGHAAINNFYNEGGGILVGSGGDNGDGHQEDLYYDFVNAPRGQIFGGDPTHLTALGQSLGFSPADIAHTGCPAALSGLDCPENSFFPLPTGSSLKIAELDNAGNPVTLFQDTDPPSTTITSAPPPLVVSRGPASASFTFSPSENLVTFECRLDSGAFAPCTSPVTYTNLSEGDHVFSVRAADAAGNVESAPPAVSWLLAFDRDGDGFTRFSNPPDCNDNNLSIFPGAPEARGGHVDSDCDGVIDPFLRLHAGRAFQVSFSHGATLVTTAAVSSVPAGSTVRISCAGRGPCPFRPESVKVKRRHATISFTRLLRNRRLHPGLVLVIRITAPQSIGFYWSEAIHQPPALPTQQIRCMNPGKLTPRTVCPDYSP